MSAVAVVTRVLVVEDDINVAEVVVRYLEQAGYTVEHEADGQRGLDRALADLPDLVVLDLMLPGLDGLEVCRRLRAVAPVPVIMLTARGEETDRLLGLEIGADDYVTKPFSPRELTARVKAVLRRAQGADLTGAVGDPLSDGDGRLSVDPRSREVRVEGTLIDLTSREFELLVFMMRQPRRAFTREELLEHVWGYTFGDTATITVHIRRLREKIEPDPSQPRTLVTVWGVGYRFEPAS